MTGGTVVILGRTGKNFAAGMSGGIAYVLDAAHDLYRKVNKGMVSIENLTGQEDIEVLRRIITEHYQATSSQLAKRILMDFDAFVPQFKKIVPDDYKRMLDTISTLEQEGKDHAQAELEAFSRNTRR